MMKKKKLCFQRPKRVLDKNGAAKSVASPVCLFAIYIGTDRPTAVFDHAVAAPGVKVGPCGQNLPVVTFMRTVYVASHLSSNSSLIELVGVAFDCQHWTTVQTILGLRKNAIKSKMPGLSFASGPTSIETCSFVFRLTCPSKKPIRRNNAVTHCRVSFFRSFEWLTTQRWKGVFFFFFCRQTPELLFSFTLQLGANCELL